MKKLLTMTLALTMAVSLTACGTDTSTVGTTAEATETAHGIERAEWSLTDIAALSDIVTGITDREYAENVGANYVIYEDVHYDHDIVYTVLFNTASVRFDTPGEYNMTYWIYFDTVALAAWADGNDVDLTIPDADRLAVTVYATVTITAEDDLSESDEDTETDDVDTTVSDGGTTADAKSAVSGSSGGTPSVSCSHTWVKDGGYYESVLVQEAYDSKEAVGSTCQCNGCGFQSDDPAEIGAHARANGCPGSYKTVYVYETVHHDAIYATQWVQSYKCSKCGATK